MAIFTIRHMKENSLFKNQTAVMMKDTDQGPQAQGTWKSKLLPGAHKELRPELDRSTMTYPISLDEKELNEIVKKFNFADPDTGKKIVTADPEDQNDPFFSHDKLTLDISGSGATLNDDTYEGKFWKAVASADKVNYIVNGEETNPIAIKGAKYSLTTADSELNEIVNVEKEGITAAKIYAGLTQNPDQMIRVARALGVSLSADYTIPAIESLLYRKITIDKDQKNLTGKRNIVAFLEVSNLSTEDLIMREMITQGVEAGIIQVKGNSRYAYGDIILGRGLEESFNMMSLPDNSALKSQFIERITALNKTNAKKGDDKK